MEVQRLINMNIANRPVLWRLCKTMVKIMKDYRKEFKEYPNGRAEYMKLKGLALMTRKKAYDYDIKKGVVYLE